MLQRCLLVLIGISATACRSPETELETATSPETVSRTVWTESTEVFFEYAPIVAGGDSATWIVHVTRRADFSPETERSVHLELVGPSVVASEPVQPASRGIFRPKFSVGSAGVYAVALIIGGEEQVDLGSLQVYQSFDDAPARSEESGAEIHLSKEEQWTIDFAVVEATERSVQSSFEVSGILEAAATHVAEVVAPVSGVLRVEDNMNMPSARSHVEAQGILATITPLALETSYAAAKSAEERSMRTVARLRALYEVQAIPEWRLIEAENDLNVARSALRAVDTTGGRNGGEYNVNLFAPIGGYVADRAINAGDVVDVGQLLYRIVDPSELWIRLYLHPHDVEHAGEIASVAFTVEGSHELYHTRSLLHVGSEINPITRTLPVVLSVDNSAGELKVGMFADGRAFIQGTTEGVAAPVEAIQIEDGNSMVYVQTGGESFERRQVVLGPTDGEFVIVEQGVVAGELLVYIGAYHVYLASLSLETTGSHTH